MANAPCVHFADCVLNPGARELSRDGRVVPLSPKAFQVLALLVRRHGEAVSKAELLEVAWPHVYVGDSSLARTIVEIRRAIGDQHRRPPFLRTVHRFGYAFRGPVTEPPDAATAVHWLICGRREFPMTDGEHVVGRDQRSAIWLNGSSVSRRHARFIVSGCTVTVEDLGSKNGTLVQSRRIERATTLAPDDEIRIGAFILRLCSLAPDDDTATRAE
jgi:DNA-binding winged helix-turn-helix (wHTH) protein